MQLQSEEYPTRRSSHAILAPSSEVGGIVSSRNTVYFKLGTVALPRESVRAVSTYVE